ncbi:MAG: hypothetical protein WAO61_06630 [Solirubrobacterales bacterium]
MSRPEVRSPTPGRLIWLSRAATRSAVRPVSVLVAIVFAALLGLSTPGSAAAKGPAVDQARSVSLLFMPGPVRSPAPLLAEDLERLPGFNTGLLSPTLGRYSPTQMMLDIGQGARVASSLYKPVVAPAPGVVYDSGANRACLRDWSALRRRAADTPGAVEPGLLGETVRASSLDAAWAVAAGDATVSAIASVSGSGPARCGDVASAFVVAPARLLATLDILQRVNRLVIAAIPPGGAGVKIVRRLALQRERLIVVVQAPPDPARTRLLAVAVKGLDGEGSLTSSTTRRRGLVAAIDIAPTILSRLGLPEPAAMQGRPIVSSSPMTSGELREMAQRLELIAGRRLPLGRGMLVLVCLLLIGVLGLGRITGRYEQLARTSQRIVGLSLLWLPVMLLFTAVLRPTRMVETDIAAGGSVLLAILSDRVARWPRAPWIPVLTTLAVHGLDFALLGSRFTGESLLGSNPLYGARFFGVGNELEAVLTVSGLIGAGALMCGRQLEHPARWFAVAGVAMVMFLGLGRLGADVGGVVMVTAGFGVAAVYAAQLRLTAGRVTILLLAPVIALALIVGLDAVSGGESHLSRTVLRADNPGDLATVIDRRFRASINGAQNDGIWLLVIAAILLLAWAWFTRDRLMARLAGPGEDPARRRPFGAALVGGLAATIVGALANDSGPAILIIGTIYLLMGLLYVRGRPLETSPGRP